jgi:hypothetical protein
MSKALTFNVLEENGFERAKDSRRRICYAKFHFYVYYSEDKWKLVNIRKSSKLEDALIIETEKDLHEGMIESQ